MEEWQVDELFSLVTRAASYTQLPRSAYDATLDLLSGRYPSEEFAELRPRIVWDRVTGSSAGARAPSGSPSPAAAPSPTAASSASSSSARRPAAWASSTRRWSTSPGWATSSRSAPPAGGSRTSPTTGCSSPPRRASPAACRSGRATRSADPPSSERPSVRSPASWPPSPRPRPSTASASAASTSTPRPTWSPTSASSARPPRSSPATPRSSSSGSATSSATGASSSTPPTARRSTPPGRWRSTPGCASASTSTGRPSPPTTASSSASPTPTPSRPTGEVIVFEPEEIEQLVTQEVGGSALFASRFRECAARALLLPRRDPGRRSPLWQQRQRSAQLLEVASQYPAFPIVLEAVRECLQDVYDLPALVTLLGRVQRREVTVLDVATTHAQPVRPQPALRLRRPVRLRGRLPHRRAPGRRALPRPGPARRAARPRRAARAARP